MILKLIVPRQKIADSEKEKFGWEFHSILSGVKKYPSMVAAIPIIAGATPKGVDIIIQDENIEEIDFDEKVDIVGITANTSLAPRAYEIADEFRSRDVKTVLGGIHFSMMPYEAIQHADAVVIGEAELIWPEVIEDAKNNGLKKFYSSSEKPDIDVQPLPRYDLLKNDKYNYYNLQTARGCAYNCNFCSVTKYFGRKYRAKSVDRVIEEIEYTQSIEKKLIFMVDDHFAHDRKRTKELLRKMIPLKQPYTIQARLEIYKDEELLELLHDSMCLSIIVGFESINQKNLDKVGKKYSVDVYKEAIDKIQSKGLLILGAFMFGLDEDDEDVFEDTVNFIKESGVGNCFQVILTPLPGTDLYQQFESEGRLLHKDWTLYDTSHVCFKPKKMSVEELQNGFNWANQQMFELNTTWKRLIDLYSEWNNNKVRYYDRTFPLMMNLASHHVAYSYPIAEHPASFGKSNV